MGSKREVLLSVEEAGALEVPQRYNPRDLLTRLWPDSFSHHHVAEPEKCSAPVPPRVPDNDFTAGLKMLFALLLVVCAVLNTAAPVLLNQQLYRIVIEEVALLTICAAFVLVPILLKSAIRMREQKNMLRTMNVKTVSVHIQHV
ncbi:hypothetical protein INR49_010313 [Caranx melampygus]|nr:hypothetical protein INR49_010313 [Caranx melampygus]